MSSQSKVTRSTWILFGMGALLAAIGCVAMGIGIWLDSTTTFLIGIGVGWVLGLAGLMFCLGAVSEAGLGSGAK